MRFLHIMRLGVDLLERRPEAQGAITHRKLGWDRMSALLQIEQQLAPALFGFANAILDRQEVLVAALT